MLSHESRVFLLLQGLPALRQSGKVCCSRRVGFWWVLDKTWIEELVWWVSVYSWGQAVRPTARRVVNPEEQLFFYCRRLHAVQVFFTSSLACKIWFISFGGRGVSLATEMCSSRISCHVHVFASTPPLQPASLSNVPTHFLWGGPVL